MRLQIVIRMDNAAFEDTGEASRILRKLADDMAQYSGHYESWRLLDANGNTVGEATIIE